MLVCKGAAKSLRMVCVNQGLSGSHAAPAPRPSTRLVTPARSTDSSLRRRNQHEHDTNNTAR